MANAFEEVNSVNLWPARQRLQRARGQRNTSPVSLIRSLSVIGRRLVVCSERTRAGILVVVLSGTYIK